MEDNAYHVVTVAEGSHLDGFVVWDGYANKNITNDFEGRVGVYWQTEQDLQWLIVAFFLINPFRVEVRF